MNFQPGGEGGALIRTRRHAVMAVRLLVLVVLALTFYYQTLWRDASIQLLLVLGLLGASNVAYWFVGRGRFESARSYSVILIFDAACVSLLVALLGSRNPTFFVAYFLTVLVAAFSRRVLAAVIVSLVAVVIFGVFHAYAEGAHALLTQVFSLQVILLFVTALLAGYMAEAMEMDRLIAVQSNPTTGLPGYSLIRSELERRIASGEKFAVCYIDNDNFKAYNDHYGYARGDSLIKTTGDTIVGSVRMVGNPDDFVGHVGGDDFLVVTTPDKVEKLCGHINLLFQAAVCDYYDTIALRKGYIKEHDRKGVTAIFPVMSLSMAVISNENRDLRDSDQIAEIAARLKKKAKSEKDRIYVTGDTTAIRKASEIKARPNPDNPPQA